ncbi:MAG: acetylxylan esterase [SAR202 cluster bacterium]|nr:hypothetical protein [Chloroflexota bacterium]MDP6662701.1 acetylxylan esterase [SAR202 cluster bacterium]MQG58587.1 acetylxylan esterase [SAR202 cluster bacterium]MQG70146.1 acetylxylan esterase [SAR202 cluster bacterium]HAL49398.1 hypothetical protein [Dehalococcoidia bacterium]|tara:strand:+ start:2736 stop:3641 length:906 start_codon:yes stop_codon:yes gene_type:complete
MTMTQPPDFDQYWAAVADDLRELPERPEIDPLPVRSTDFADAYSVRLTSVGPYRLFGYLSIPKGDGPFPAIYWAPKYASVLEPVPQGTANEIRRQYVTFACSGRGQRNADQPFAAMFPGLLTEGIESPDSYIFRGIAADAVRGLEYVASRPEVDRSRVVAMGNDIALIAAAQGAGATHVVSTPALFVDTIDRASQTSAYPLEEINDYLRHNPFSREDARRSLSYFDLRWHAPRFTGKSLLMADAPDGVLDAGAVNAVAAASPGDSTVHESESSSYLDGMVIERWVAREFGFDEPIVPEHWR